MTGERIVKIAGWVAVGLVAATGIGLVLGLVVQALWNWLMPDLFGLPEITYWQAVGLFVLCHLLFKGHGDHGNGSHHTHHTHTIRERVQRAVRGQGGSHDPDAESRADAGASAAPGTA